MPAFSIIVPAYNVQDYIEEALQSIAGQSFTDWEAIIIDDGSTDASGAIAKKLCARDPRFRYIRQQNRGQSAARNLGTSVAVGSYLYYMDSDDIIDNDTLSVCYKEFEDREVDVVVFEAVVFPPGSPEYRLEEHYYQRPLGDSPIWSGDFVVQSLRQGRYCVSPCCLIARRTAIGDLRFMDGTVYEDNCFFVSLMLNQRLKVAVLNQRLYKRRLRADSTMVAAKTLHHYNSMYRILREMSGLSFDALEPPERAVIREKIIGNALGDLHFVSALVGPDMRLRKMNVAATWHVATHVSARLFTPKRILLALVPELYKFKAGGRRYR
ncbi:glycosyltransferase family 2 protein [Paraburkholderia strydomiana]|uniref:glycosyltransferase family 2 protein n=1 Tax=Paraburkholderia strydomiana TaxID=1245417 RepID=UPI0038B7E852